MSRSLRQIARGLPGCWPTPRGYAVRVRDGERLGQLMWLTYALDDPWPVGLRVQPPGSGERTLSDSWEIPLAQVAFVRPARREVVITAE